MSPRASSAREAVRTAAILLLGAALGAGADRLVVRASQGDASPPVALPEEPRSVEPRSQERPSAARLVEVEVDAGAPAACNDLYDREKECYLGILETAEKRWGEGWYPCKDFLAMQEFIAPLSMHDRRLHEKLVPYLADTHPPYVRAIAAWILSEVRAAAAIEPLLDNIDIDPQPPCVQTRRLAVYEHPAVRALHRIGKPVVLPTLEHLTKEDLEVRRNLRISVLEATLGEDEARRTLQCATDTELDMHRKFYLQDALNWAKYRH